VAVGGRRGSHGGAGGGGGAGSGNRRPEALAVTRSLRIPLEELMWRFTTAGGPGGQHASRSSTRVEVRFDVLGSPSLGPRQRARLLERLGPVARASAGEERSQARNRSVALERLASKLAAALRVERPRVPTRPPPAAEARRLEDKRRQAALKRGRREGRRPEQG
jgi:ribosome-associated protein